MSLGLRWEFWTPYREKYNRLTNIDLKSLSPTSMQVVLPDNTTLNSIPGLPAGRHQLMGGARPNGGIRELNRLSQRAHAECAGNDFAPHLAAAYRLNDKWVVRGGYGTYFWPMPLSQVLQSARVNPPLNLRYQNNVDDANGTNGVYALTSVPATSDMLGSNGSATVSAGGVSSSAQPFLAMDVHNWADNKAQEWTFTVERVCQAIWC